MTKPYLFRFVDKGHDAVAAVRLDAEPVMGQCVWIAGKRLRICGLYDEGSHSIIEVDNPPAGYREPRNAIGTLSTIAD